MIEMKNVYQQYGNDVVLHDIHCRVKKGKVTALIGESGSGKSTIAELLVSLRSPTSGKIERHTSSIQYIYQNPERSFNPYWTMWASMEEALRGLKYPKKQWRSEIVPILKQLELPEDTWHALPHECSGGQKQRFAIARALLQRPDVLIADEITSALDPENEQKIIQHLKKIHDRRSMTILYITHRFQELSSFIDDVYVLKEGRIVEYGTYERVMSQPQHSYTEKLIEASTYFERKRKEDETVTA